MTEIHWLDAAAPGPRRLLLGVTGATLLVGTLWLERMHLTLMQSDAIAAGCLGGLAILWSMLRWRTQPHLRARSLGAARRRAEAHDARSLVAGNAVADRRRGIAPLSQRDPALSVPALVERGIRLWRAAAQGDPRAAAWVDAEVPPYDTVLEARVAGVQERPGVTRCTIDLRTHDGRVTRLGLERPTLAASRSPDELATLDAPHRDDWHLTDARDLEHGAFERAARAPTLEADLRALRGRDPDFQPDALLERARFVAQRLSEGDEATLAPLATPEAVAAVSAPRKVTDAPPVWISAGSDGWYDLADIDVGGLRLSFLRPVAASDAGWQIWRVVGGLS